MQSAGTIPLKRYYFRELDQIYKILLKIFLKSLQSAY